MYTHPGGYKFILRLSPHGNSVYAGTHVSMNIGTLKGYNNTDNLKFPVKFTITVQLLNQYRDQDHHTRDVSCNLKIRGGSGLIGCDYKFISHSDLEWNCDKQTQYLKDDSLKFRITKIVVH